ncbi:MAG: ATP-binding cassette domain-containing protein [Salegentibacter sp.]|uniref:ABC-type multidrug transport system, ATPase component n=1 Tax=Salegentibacter flavus TaxID=287099 RepID=A0A1I4ZF68_9FLAO|nr:MULTISPECIES: ATP-binding cassette domain-containing protein [Salegentibacter]MDR9456794.1 ATP-binding cassette domain-containing protein [Salegentibacter sp.]SFN48619.1 ABC-type multidrug transport system, ATPase component [Salegentibacter flavus]
MVFELENIELNFGEKNILYGVYLKTETGKVTGLLGTNGCGKTSLLKIFFGNLTANNQLIRVDGKGYLNRFYRTKMVKFLSQKNYLPLNIKLKSLFNLFNINWAEFAEIFPKLALQKNHRIAELSGGEKRLVETWLIIKSDAKLVLLDEPFTHLDPIYMDIIKQEILREKQFKAFVITDHLYKEIQEIADDLYFLKKGCTKLITSPLQLEELGYINPEFTS